MYYLFKIGETCEKESLEALLVVVRSSFAQWIINVFQYLFHLISFGFHLIYFFKILRIISTNILFLGRFNRESYRTKLNSDVPCVWHCVKFTPARSVFFYQTWTRLAQISSWRISTSFNASQVKPYATRRKPTHFYVRRLTRRDFFLVSLTVRHSIRNILTQDERNIWLWLEVNPWASWHRWGQVDRTRLRNAYARIVFDFHCAVFIFGQTN